MTQQLTESQSKLSEISESVSTLHGEQSPTREPHADAAVFWAKVTGVTVGFPPLCQLSFVGVGGAFSAGETSVLTRWGTICPETSFSPVAPGGKVSPSPKMEAVPQTGRKNSSRALMEVFPGCKFRRELNYYKSKPSSLSVLGNHHFFHFQGLHFSSVLHAYPRLLFIIPFHSSILTPVITPPCLLSMSSPEKPFYLLKNRSTLVPPCNP